MTQINALPTASAVTAVDDVLEIEQSLSAIYRSRKISVADLKVAITPTASEIRDALTTLTTTNRLDASAIKNLPSGGGAVDSVNGEIGVVVLDAADIAETATRKWLSDTERTKLTGIETAATSDQTATEIRDNLATLTTTNRLGAASIKDLTNQTASEVRDSLETLSGTNRLDAAFVDGLGTAAFVNTGTSANQVVVLTAAAKLPAVDGSLLTNLPGGSEWAISGTVSSNFTAVSGTRYPCSTVGGTFTVTLPTSGRVWLFDAAGNSSSTGFGTNLLTVTPTGGQTVMGSSSLSLNRGAIGAILELIGSDWRVLNAR